MIMRAWVDYYKLPEDEDKNEDVQVPFMQQLLEQMNG